MPDQTNPATTTTRRDISGSLAGATLTTARAADGIDYSPVALMPDVKVIKVGGQSMLGLPYSGVGPPYGGSGRHGWPWLGPKLQRKSVTQRWLVVSAQSAFVVQL